jgi:hypothetical protein
MEFYSAIKKKEILLFVGKWMELENITLREFNQGQKAKSSMFSLICATNVAKLFKKVHAKERSHMRRGG